MDIIVKDVRKRYGNGQEALRGISLHIGRGMFGLLGPNGAGKTSLLRILATLLQPSSGQILIGGHDLAQMAERKKLRTHLGYLPQEISLYPDLTAREFLDYMGLLKGLRNRQSRRNQIEALLEVTSLTSAARRKIKTYSGGMKRRVGIAQALLGDPRLLIVDEPTAGLDPEERIRLRTLLSNLARDRTILLSTHVVEDIGQTCQQLAVLHQGQIAFDGSTKDLIAAAQQHTWQFLAETSFTPEADQSIISAIPQAEGTLYRIVGSRPEGQIFDIRHISPTLEDGYVWLRQQATHPMIKMASR